MNRSLACGLGLLWTLYGCAVGPDYHRPAVPLPHTYRDAQAAPAGRSSPAEAEDFAKAQWWTVFQDSVLQSLIREALQNNYDVRIAANRVVQAGEQLGVTRANEFPAVSGFAQAARAKPTPGAPVTTEYATGFQLSWMVDFWGQYRRATEAARANLLSATYAREAVRVTLLSNVATYYFQLRGLDREMAASQRILATNQETLRITSLLVIGGANAITDQLQAKLLVQQAQAQITQLEVSIRQTENQISILLGRNPGPILRGLALDDEPHLPQVPVGLPAALLAARPDILEAEQALVAANADVGAAKAAFFPQIPLTATGGTMSPSLSHLVDGSASLWSTGGELTQPLFEGGRLRSAYRLAKAQRDAAELAYGQTIQQALGDVSNALIGYDKSRSYRQTLEDEVATYAEAARMANDRYRGGATGFLEVLTTQQQFLTAELQLAEAWSNELQTYVQLYQALGGGWQS